MRFGKSLIEQQIEVFLEWGRRAGITPEYYREWLGLFVRVINKKDIMEVVQEDVDLFMQRVYDSHDSSHYQKQAQTSVRAIIRFYMARSKNAAKRVGRGRPLHIDQIKKAQDYKKKNKLSLTEIGKLLGGDKPIDKSQISRWLKKPLEMLK